MQSCAFARGGAGLRRSTLAWFERTPSRLSLESSLQTRAAAYASARFVGRDRLRSRRRQENRAAFTRRRHGAARARRDRVSELSMASAIARGPSGSNRSAASPATSASAPRFEHATGTPRVIASSTGNPNPSYNDGKTKPSRARYSAFEVVARDPVEKARVRGDTQLRSVRLEPRLVRRCMARQHEQRADVQPEPARARRASARGSCSGASATPSAAARRRRGRTGGARPLPVATSPREALRSRSARRRPSPAGSPVAEQGRAAW